MNSFKKRLKGINDNGLTFIQWFSGLLTTRSALQHLSHSPGYAHICTLLARSCHARCQLAHRETIHALPDQNTPRYFCAQSFHLVLCLRLPRQAAGGSAARTPRLVDELLCLLRRSHFNTKPAAANAPFFPQLNQHSFFKTDKKQNALITFTTFKNKHCRGSVSQDM